MPFSFSALVSGIANGWKGASAIHSWLTNAALRREFETYLRELEGRRVLYAPWELEDISGVLNSLDEVLQVTRSFRATHENERELRDLIGRFIKVLQRETDTIRGCNVQTSQGQVMAYTALLKIRSELARMLAVLCGALHVDPHDFDLQQFIMNMAIVRPPA